MGWEHLGEEGKVREGKGAKGWKAWKSANIYSQISGPALGCWEGGFALCSGWPDHEKLENQGL